MPWVEALTDPNELRRCVRDLVALSTLPAVWTNYSLSQIADSVAAALLSTLDADFVYIALPPLHWGEPSIEAAHFDRRWTIPLGGETAIRASLHKAWLGRPEQTGVISNPVGHGTISVVAVPIGFQGDAVVVAGSRRPKFPTHIHRLLLRIAADATTVALQRQSAELGERCFVSLVERSTDFISIVGLDGAPHYINPAGLRLVGLETLEQARRLHVADFLLPEERARAREMYWPEAIRTGRWSGELIFRNFGTGRALPFLVDWFRIDNPCTTQPMNIATVGRDLTAQKRSEAELRHFTETLEHSVADGTAELAEANDRLRAQMIERERTDVRLQKLQLELFHAARLSTAGQMAAALAHEINQPLTAVTNSVHAVRRLLAKDALPRTDTARAILDEAAEQALRGAHIIRRLRDLVTYGDSQKQIENLQVLIKEASALALTGSAVSHIQVSLRFDPKALEIIADRIQIQQVLMNLIRNAAEAMAETRRRELEVTTTLIDDQTVQITVADRGPGLPKEMARELFRPFVSSKRDGMGLGLVICRSIVEAHGGRLWSEPNPGGGTIFLFTLGTGLNGGESNVG